MHPVGRAKGIWPGQTSDRRANRQRARTDNQGVITQHFLTAISVSEEEFVV
jgi:hypothetical protein